MGGKTRKTLIDGKSWDEQCEIIIADEAIGRISLVTNDFNSIINRLGFDGVELEKEIGFCRNRRHDYCQIRVSRWIYSRCLVTA